jgi:hypothetical protein
MRITVFGSQATPKQRSFALGLPLDYLTNAIYTAKFETVCKMKRKQE